MKYDFLVSAIEFDTEECIIWPFAQTTQGYGLVIINGVRCLAHRVACAIVHGEPLEPTMDAAHGPCHNRLCFNPKHISWETRQENILDRYRDNIMLYGEAVKISKLTEEQVIEARKLYYEDKISQVSLAAKYQVGRTTIREAIHGKTWKHLL